MNIPEIASQSTPYDVGNFMVTKVLFILEARPQSGLLLGNSGPSIRHCRLLRWNFDEKAVFALRQVSAFCQS
jgi:hypothetical protein